MIAHGANDWDNGLYSACRNGNIELVKLMIENGSTKYDICLQIACVHGYIEIANLMIAYGATDCNWSLYSACQFGHIELAKLMIAHGATDLKGALQYCNNESIREFIKSQCKLNNVKAVSIIRMLRRYIKRLHNSKRIQRWWRGTYPLWRELAYAPPKGLRYLQAYERFTKASKSKI